MSTLNEILRANTAGAGTVALVGKPTAGLLRELGAAFSGQIQTTADVATIREASLNRTVYAGDFDAVLRGAGVVLVQYGLIVDGELLAKALGSVSPGVWVVAVGNLPAGSAVGSVMTVTGEEKTLSPAPWFLYRSRRNGAPIACACKRRRG
jgi:hypothetical protein